MYINLKKVLINMFKYVFRVCTDLVKSLNLTLVLELIWNFVKLIDLENVKLSLKIIKYINPFRFFAFM